jgi:hypothetical protein
MRDFLTSPQGLHLRHVIRFMRRLYIRIDGIEPRSKGSMRLSDKLAIQQAVLHHMESRHRKAFRGPLVLEVRATTTEQTPAHAQTIAKNLLDLLGPPLPVLARRRRGILYFDDSQVHALSVSVQHGASSPEIYINARRYGDFLEDLSLACYAGSHSTRGDSLPGDLSPQGRRYELQGTILGMSHLELFELATLLGAPLFGAPADHALSREIEEESRSNPVRIVLPELPQRAGATEAYRVAVRERIDDFQKRFAGALRPLLHPVAMEVLIKPPPPSRRFALHDLDNVTRNHLIPAIAAQLQPPFYGPWAQGRAERLRTPDADLGEGDHRSRLPKSTLIGLTRYSVFQQARSVADSTPGSVTVSLVADEWGYGAVFTKIDSAIEHWENTL